MFELLNRILNLRVVLRLFMQEGGQMLLRQVLRDSHRIED